MEEESHTNKNFCKSCLVSTKAKLWLYVSSASLASIIADLSHYTCPQTEFSSIPPVKMACIFLNLILQGVIAWRAFIDDSYSSEESKQKFRDSDKK